MSGSSKLFGTDGVRGRANYAPMTVETALALGRATGMLFRKGGDHRPRVVIGKDTRRSCYMIENALIAGLCSMGVETLMVGPLPTPGVAFITRAYRADAGIVISASHNNFRDNGIKFFNSDGYKFSDSWEAQVEALVARNDFSDTLPDDVQIGRNTKVVGADGRYIEFVKATYAKRRTLNRMKIVLDCANGAAYHVAPLVFRELDADVHAYSTQPNGMNINDRCGSLHPQLVQKAVIDHSADVGIALDGDADRVVLVDENAQIVDGDAILAICARDMKQRGMLTSNTVVGTVMSNLGFMKAMESLGIQVVRSKVGDRHVLHDMLKSGSNLGGEQSGHILFLDHNTTGDGLVSALQVLRIMLETDSRLSDLATIVKRYPQSCVNVQVSSKPPLEEMESLDVIVKRVENLLSNQGRILVRYSGTENICRVMVEGPKQQTVDQMAQDVAGVIGQEIGVRD